MWPEISQFFTLFWFPCHLANINYQSSCSLLFYLPLLPLKQTSSLVVYNSLPERMIIPIIFYSNSMSIQIKSNQFLYNLIELTLRKKYTRVIRICEYLESQGISSHQLIVIKSYAVSQAKGYEDALRGLDNSEGLLVNTAKIQYQQMVSMYAQCQGLFEAVTGAEGGSILDQLKGNNQILAGVRNDDVQSIIGSQEGRCCRFVINKKEEEIVRRINTVTDQYERKKALFEGKQISQDQMGQHCRNFVRQYRQILNKYHPSGKIKELIDQYILFLTSYPHNNY